MMSREESKAIVRRLCEAINTGNLDVFDEILTTDYVRHDPTTLQRDADREKIKQGLYQHCCCGR